MIAYGMDRASAAILDSENCEGLGRRGRQSNILGGGWGMVECGPMFNQDKTSCEVLIFL